MQKSSHAEELRMLSVKLQVSVGLSNRSNVQTPSHAEVLHMLSSLLQGSLTHVRTYSFHVFAVECQIGNRGRPTTMLGESAPLGQPASNLGMTERQKVESERG